MARVQFNPSISGMRGKIGGLVYRRQNEQTVVFSRRPRKTPRVSAAQKDQRSRFQEAQAYAAEVLSHPLRRAHYQKLAAERGQPPNALLISNFLTPPEIELVDVNGYAGRPKQPIEIVATDAVEVTAVHVTLRGAGAAVVESGAATFAHGVWTYRATAEAPRGNPCTIEVVAHNRAGATATRTISRAL